MLRKLFRNLTNGIARIVGIGQERSKPKVHNIHVDPQGLFDDYLAGGEIPPTYFTKRHTRGRKAGARRALRAMHGTARAAALARVRRHVGPHGTMP